MANHKTTDQPGRERARNQNAQNSGGQRSNDEKVMPNANKSKQDAGNSKTRQ